MRNVWIADMTLREGAHLSFREKIEAARLLDKVHADVIELAQISDERADPLLCRTIAPLAQHSVLSCPAGLTHAQADAAMAALAGAHKPRLHVLMPASAARMEYELHKKPAQAIALLADMTRYCAQLCADVEVSLQDASRSEPAFLMEMAKAACEAGAKTVTLCDEAGVLLPEEARKLAEEFSKLPVVLGLECGNALALSVANALAGISAGAGLIKCTAGNGTRPGLEAVSHALLARGDALMAQCGLYAPELSMAAQNILRMTGLKRGAATESAVSAPETRAGELSEQSPIGDVRKRVRQLGYELSPEDMGRVYEAFLLTAKRKRVGTRDLEAIIASNALQVPPTYRLLRYVINSGNTIAATAHVELEKDGRTLSGVCAGDGPIDAAFLAIEQILGHHYELDDFQIQSVTQGREAMGDALVKLRANGRLFSGKGASTDIIGASVLAYLSALNKIVNEQNA